MNELFLNNLQKNALDVVWTPYYVAADMTTRQLVDPTDN